jgi:hypothetical protein
MTLKITNVLHEVDTLNSRQPALNYPKFGMHRSLQWMLVAKFQTFVNAPSSERRPTSFCKCLKRFGVPGGI